MRRQCCQVWIMLHMAMRYSLLAETTSQERPVPPGPPPVPAHLSISLDFRSNCTDLCFHNATSFNTTTSVPKRMEELKFRNKNSTTTINNLDRTFTITTQRRLSMTPMSEDDPWGSAHTMNRPVPQTRQFSPFADLFGNTEPVPSPSLIREGRIYSTEVRPVGNPPVTASLVTSTPARRPTSSTRKIANTTVNRTKSLRVSTETRRPTLNTTRFSTKPSTRNREFVQRNDDGELFNYTSVGEGPMQNFFLITLNGSCNEIETSQVAAQNFVAAFEHQFSEFFDDLSQDKIRVWQISCGSVIVNFSIENWPLVNEYSYMRDHIFEKNFSVFFARKHYDVIAFEKSDDSSEHVLAHLEVAPAAGHVYQGFIYIVVGVLVGVLALIIATVVIVRLHRRKGRASGFAASGDSTPVKYDNVHDYTLTRIPRTTKLFLDDVERNPWAYTNPDFHGSLSSVAAPGKKMEYLNFVNTGVIPMRDRSPASSMTNNPLLSVQVTDSSSDGKSGSDNAQGRKNAKGASVKQSFSAFDNGPGKLKMLVSPRSLESEGRSSTGTPVPLTVKMTQEDIWNSSHI